MKYQTKTIFAGLMGNVVEAYDMAICFYLSMTLSQRLMGNAQSSPYVVYALIGLVYLIKPIGAIALGLGSDRFGRKKTIFASIMITSLATALMGLIPAYSDVGRLSVLLFMGLSTIQSLAIGSNFLNSTCFLVESGDVKSRGYRGCWSAVGVKGGTLLALLVVEGGNIFYPGYGELWRIPLLLAILGLAVGVLIRYRIPESLDYVIYYATQKKPSSRILCQRTILFIRQHPLLLSFAFFTSFLSIISHFFFYVYLPHYAVYYVHLPYPIIMTSTCLSLLVSLILIPIFGALSDQQERLSMLTFSTAGLLMLAYPLMVVIHSGNIFGIFMVQLFISIPCAGYYSVCSVLLVELFPMQIRCTVLSLTFSLAAGIAASLPILINGIAHITHWPNSPCLVMIISAACLLCHVKKLSEGYCSGKNTYHSSISMESSPTLNIQYQRVTKNE